MRHLVLVLAAATLALAPPAVAQTADGAEALVPGPTSPPPETPPESPVAAGSAAPDEGPSALRGKIYLQTTCSGCHAVGASEPSTNPDAPPFREIMTRYDPADLEESLAEGIVTGHADMPEVVLDPPEIANVVAYLDALKVVTGP